MSGGTAYIIGNASAPPTDDTVAVEAKQEVKKVERIAKGAQEASEIARSLAQEAEAVAEATNQHFWHRDSDPSYDGAGTGAFVTDEEQDTFLDAMAHDIQPTTQRPLHNLLMNAEGILLRAAKRIRAAFTPDGVAFYDGQGNDADNIVAAFGTDGFQIGTEDESHLVGDYHSLKLIDTAGNTYFHIADIIDRNGNVPEEFVGDGSTKTFTLTISPTSASPVSVTVNGTATTDYTYSNPTITFTTAPANGAIIIVTHATNLIRGLSKSYTLGIRGSGKTGYASYAEGYNTLASGGISHAEGAFTKATGGYSHAEGYSSEASGQAAHAEGFSEASGDTSHSEGYHTVASGEYSHAQNKYTIAAGANQTAIGKFNIEDTNDEYAFIIGNGSGTRSNAFTVDWDGNVVAAGTIKATVQESTVTVNTTNVTVGNTNACWHNGVVASLSYNFTCKSSLANNGTLAVGTLPSGYEPMYAVVGSAYTSNASVVEVTVNTSGVITIRNVTGSAIATSVTIRVGATYAI